MNKPLQAAITKARASAAERRANIANGSADYPKLSAWLALYADNDHEGRRVVELARVAGVADFDPDQQAQGDSQAAPPGTKGATDAEVAALAARIVGYVQ